jgi:3-keto-5-aminohexanoate cleavage enzyme
MYSETAFMALYEGVAPSGIASDPMIINACLTGNVLGRESSPHLPVSTQQIVEDGLQAVANGASMLHIHARDAEGRPEWRPEGYAPIFEGIRRHDRDVVLIATTTGREHGSIERRAAVLDLDGAAKPDMASLTLGSFNFPATASVNAPEAVQALALRMRERNIMPELEVFDLGMLNYGFYLRRKGLLPRDCYVNLLLGSLGAVPGRVLDLANLVREIPATWLWAAAGIGRYQLAMNVAAVIMGGNVRVGLEDSPFMDFEGMRPASNGELVARISRIARELGRPVSTPAQTRRRLRIGGQENWRATQVLIRPMAEADLPDVLALLAKWNMEPKSETQTGVRPERDHIEIGNTFVATLQGRLVGVASFLVIDRERVETASLAVDPELLGCGIGHRLQKARLDEMRARGFRHVRTEVDRPNVIRWYMEKFGYRKSGTIPKRHAFGDPKRTEWTLLELDLQA